MSIRLLSLLSLVILASTNIAPASAQSKVDNAEYLNVELGGVSKQLQFEQAARLTEVLKQAQEQGLNLHYPLATTLFDNSENALRESSALKDSVLKQMIQHNLGEHPFYHYLQAHRFAPRVLSGVDLDDIRLDKFRNPLLRGDFTLISPKREDNVIYLGNVDEVYSVRDQAGIPLKQQLVNLKNNIGELVRPPVLIYPDGKWIQTKLGAWQTSQYYLPPLTMVYIPFKEFNTSAMDQAIVDLLVQLKHSQFKPSSMKKPL